MKKLIKTLSLSMMVFVSTHFASAIALDESEARYYWKQADNLLNIEYQDQINKRNSSEQADLRASQRAWVQTRNENFGDPEKENDGLNPSRKFVNLERATMKRNLALKGESLSRQDEESTEHFYFRIADRVLNLDYQQTMKEHDRESDRQTLRERQTWWIGVRNGNWGDPEDSDDRPNVDTKFLDLEQGTIARILYLKAYTGNRVEKGLAGTYTDSVGGRITLKKLAGPGNRYDATLSVVRGRSGSNGEEQAVLNVSESKGDQESGRLSLPNSSGGQCVIDFSRIQHLITLTEVSGCEHGARAYYDGDYLKTDFKAL